MASRPRLLPWRLPGRPLFTPFAAVQGSSLRYNTGSSIDLRSLQLLAGFAAGGEILAGSLSFGAFFEFGTGSCNTRNSSVTGSLDGEGGACYIGWASSAAGTSPTSVPGTSTWRCLDAWAVCTTPMKTTMCATTRGTPPTMTAAAPTTASTRVLDISSISPRSRLDLYGWYFWTRVNGEELTLSTGEAEDFEDFTSSRLRFGTRLTYDVDEKVRPYIGVAYEHEFDGRARGTSMGFGISSPSLKGDTGMGEIGIPLTPSEDVPFSLDLSVQGYVGKREGATGSSSSSTPSNTSGRTHIRARPACASGSCAAFRVPGSPGVSSIGQHHQREHLQSMGA